MSMVRWLRHLFAGRSLVLRHFPLPLLQDIEQSVHAGEQGHSGELRVALEAGLSWGELRAGRTARDRAIEVFSQLRLWDTEHNNGVLIYVLLAEHDVEIVADRGLNDRVSAAQWEVLCLAMERDFRAADFRGGVLQGIAGVHQLLTQHFPASANRSMAGLPDSAVVL